MNSREGFAVAAQAVAILNALNERDTARLEPLLAAEVEVATANSVRSGREAAVEWSLKDFDHLLRRFLLDEAIAVGGGLLGKGRTQYVWKEDGEVGDTTPIFFSFEFGGGGQLERLGVHEAESDARRMLGSED